MLNPAQIALVDDITTLLDGVLSNVPVENVQDVKAAFIAKLTVLSGQSKPSVTAVIGAGLRVLDDCAQLSKNVSFEEVAAVLDEGFAVVALHQPFKIVSLFSLIFKAKAAL